MQGNPLPTARLPFPAVLQRIDSASSSSSEEDDEVDDPSFIHKQSKKKDPRPPFKPDAYDRLKERMLLSRELEQCKGKVPAIKGINPEYKMKTKNGGDCYLTKDLKEMRADKPKEKWRHIDKDHIVDNIALVKVAMQELSKGKDPAEIDQAFLLGYKSTKNLKFIPRDDHKNKKTFRFDTIPVKMEKEAGNILKRKYDKLGEPKHANNLDKIKKQHINNQLPSWSISSK